MDTGIIGIPKRFERLLDLIEQYGNACENYGRASIDFHLPKKLVILHDDGAKYHNYFYRRNPGRYPAGFV